MSTQSPGPINVLLAVDDDVIDRLGSVLRLLCVGLVDEPVRASVLSFASRSAEPALGPARIVQAPRSIWPWRRLGAQEVLEELELEPPHIVHCFSPALVDRVRAWSAAWNSPLVVHLTDSHDVRRLAAMELPAGTTLVAVTPTVSRLLLELRPELEEAVRVIPVGITAAAQASCLSRPDRVPACLVTDPLTRESGMEQLLLSLREVISSGQEVQLFLLSGGPAEHRLRRMVEQLGLLHYVTFAVDMRTWDLIDDAMRGADFYLIPARPGRFSAARLTALAAGLAIIAPHGTTDDYLIDDTTARLYDPAHPEQLTSAWLALLDDRSAARRLAESALDYARTHHQASTMATATAWLYREIRQAAGALTTSH